MVTDPIRSMTSPIAGPASAPSSAASACISIWRWDSATPYLLGSIVLVMALIAVAMLMLVCSLRQERRRSAAAMASEKSVKGADFAGASVPVPEFVVIMAGDDKPTFLAMPSVLREVETAPVAGGDGSVVELVVR